VTVGRARDERTFGSRPLTSKNKDFTVIVQ
jgi:hypothetical protein